MLNAVLAVDLASGGIWTLILFGLSATGFGLFMGRILFGPSSVLGGATPASGGTSTYVSLHDLNLRSSPRTNVDGTKILVSQNQSLTNPLEGWVTDRSLGGLGLSVPQPIEVGTRLHVVPIQMPDWMSTRCLEVRYCKLHRGRWRLGCQYVPA